MKRVAVLRGGPSEEYDVSMLSGQAVLEALDQLGFATKDIVITRKGEWLDQGRVKSPLQALQAVDVVFIALHGTYGEDGQVQKLLQQVMIPHTGSTVLTSAIALDKHLTKEHLKNSGLKFPRHKKLKKDDLHTNEKISLLFEEVGGELIIKPASGGSSQGVKQARTQETLRTALRELFGSYDELLVEEFIRGREATVGVLDNFRNESTYVLPVIEIVPPGGKPVWSYNDKYNGKTEEICPGRFSYTEKAQLHEAAATAHSKLGCRHYSRSDFIVRDGEAYFLEINTLPGLTSESLFPKAAKSVGLSFEDLILHLIRNAHN